MRFYFEIDDEIFEDEFGISFQDEIKKEAIKSVADQVLSNVTSKAYYSECSKIIREIIKEKGPEIVDLVVQRAADTISRKKAIVELTPKASELAAADKDNVAYFEEMIDKAIARKFGNKT